MAADVAEGVVGEAGPSSPRSVIASAEEVLVPGEPAVALLEHVAPEDTTRAASPEIKDAKEDTGAALLQDVASGEAQTLVLTCTSWAATSESGDNAEDDKEVEAGNTLECKLNWVCCVFYEMILPATSVSFLV
jgi:hypothetical protein